ncbi:MAG TPA: M13 family metallopeptidase N-terminal domain-containing protein, partial [Thermoanaerobaculia bacterium]|nr:M13 family metallopeptidase N-terminal domain-containing protein [Thermoanaerobaculia bacterium]
MKSTSPILTIVAAAAFSSAAWAAPENSVPEVHGINPADMDPSVAACQDFNAYGNGGWLKSNPIPADQSYWGSFTILEEQNRESLHKVLEKVSKATNAAGSDDQKVGDFYFTCMDEAAVEAQGLTPLQGELAAIDKIASVAALQTEIARLQMMGVNAVFQFGSDQDRRNASEVIVGAYQGGLGLPDRDYYT